MKILQKNKLILLMAIFILLFASITTAQVYFINNLENQIQERNTVIDNLFKKDSVLNEILEIKYDSSGTKYSYALSYVGGKVLKYDVLRRMLDTAHHNNLDLIYKSEQLSDANRQVVKNYDTLVDYSNDLIEDYNEILKERNKLSVELHTIRMVQKFICEKYSISYTLGEKSVTLNAPVVDSALALLPHYRHKITSIVHKGQNTTYTIALDNK